MSKQVDWGFKVRRVVLFYFAVIPPMVLALLIYIAQKNEVRYKTMYIVLSSCVLVYYSINILWLFRSHLISRRDDMIIVTTGLFIRRTAPVEQVSGVTIKRWLALIKTSDGSSIRLPVSWLTAVDRSKLEKLLREIVENNQREAEQPSAKA